MTISTMVAALSREPLKPQNFFILFRKSMVVGKKDGLKWASFKYDVYRQTEKERGEGIGTIVSVLNSMETSAGVCASALVPLDPDTLCAFQETRLELSIATECLTGN